MKIVILTFDLPEANIATHRLLRGLGGEVSGIIHSTSILPGKSNNMATLDLGRRLGWRYGAAWQMHRWLAQAGALSLRLRGRPAGYGSLRALAREAGIPLVATANAHSGDALDSLKRWQPDLIISNYFNQVIRQPILEVPTIGTINMHPALLPRNRGLMPCFWAMAVGDDKTGATVHWIDETLDTGNIILQDALAIEPDDTVISLSQRCSELGADLLLRAIDMLREGPVPGFVQDETRRTYQSWPTPGGLRRFRKRGYRYGSPAEMWKQGARSQAPLA
ncbi:methionyl-tRNA formyltransferase [Oricola sp.]|uniref:methionyl-tRNA formyltransferase n=1 Tax=Oricola sp. TaxID=1979950 RepID=UPI003BAD4DDE